MKFSLVLKIILFSAVLSTSDSSTSKTSTPRIIIVGAGKCHTYVVCFCCFQTTLYYNHRFSSRNWRDLRSIFPEEESPPRRHHDSGGQRAGGRAAGHGRGGREGVRGGRQHHPRRQPLHGGVPRYLRTEEETGAARHSFHTP